VASFDRDTIEWPVTTAGNSDMILLAQAAPVLCGALKVLACGKALAGVDHNILLPVTKIWLPRRQLLRVCDGAVVQAYSYGMTVRVLLLA
jgi:hypothetical protein